MNLRNRPCPCGSGKKHKKCCGNVDGTLLLGRAQKVNSKLIAFLQVKHAEGFSLYLWSMRGADYALEAAKKSCCVSLFTAIISKPGHVIDDKGRMWARDIKTFPFIK